MKKGIALLLSLCVLCSLVLTGCTGDRNTPEIQDNYRQEADTIPVDNNVTEYYAESNILPSGIGVARGFCISEEYLYVLGDGSDNEVLIRRNLDGENWEGLDVFSKDYVPIAVSVYEDTLYILMQDNNARYIYCRIDGTEISPVTELSFASELTIRGFFAHEGGLLLWTDSTISQFDKDSGKLLRSKELNSMSHLNGISANGKTIYAQISQPEKQVFLPVEDVFLGDSTHAKTVESAAIVPLCISDVQGLLLGMPEGLVRFSVEKEDASRVASWTDLKGADAGTVGTMIERQDGSIYYLDSRAGLLMHATPRLVQEKTTIILATAYVDGPLYTVIRRFNESNPYYKVETRVYEFGTWDKLRVEIMAGQGPDIIDTQSLALGGDQEMYLEDLLPYIENDPDLSVEDFIPSILEAMKINGKLFYVAPEFSLNAVVAYNGVQGENLSFDAYKNAYDEQPDLDSWRFIQSAHDAFVNAFPVIENDVVLQKNGEYIVDTELLKGWLQFCTVAPGLGIGNEMISACGRLPGIRAYTLQTSDITGWPAQRSNGYYVMPSGYCTAILANSQHKEAAWSFMRYFFLAYYNDTFDKDAPDGFDMFPVIAEQFEKQLQKGLNDEDYPISEQDAQKLRNIVYSIQVPSFRHEGLKDILLPSADSYFSGQRSLEDTIAQMESKMRLFLHEQD